VTAAEQARVAELEAQVKALQAQLAQIRQTSPVPGWLFDEAGNVRPERGEATVSSRNEIGA
jgi:hypothetical protein